ncbi:response regulator transcription factor [Paenibacillus daejeonensis]|uniref:response regulator transcription factor n=1 Tax=Paenibacillus daejeonensis TaxID=135193 RepID=UPI00037BB327|nr:response regulator transcription factor [Paenibacillus daejeonensis]
MYKVLIVDDEPMILDGLPALLNWDELELDIVGFASNGKEALEIIESYTVHIIITDIRMPKMDGLDLIRIASEWGRNIKFIVLSGYNDFEYVKQAARIGIENYLLKPVDAKELTLTLVETKKKLENEFTKQIEIREGLHVLRDNTLYMWVTGDIRERELRQKAQLSQINLKAEGFSVAVIKVLSVPETFQNDRISLRFAVRNICQDTLNSKFESIPFYNLDDELIIIFCNVDSEKCGNQLEDGLNECMRNLKHTLKIDVFTAVGGYVKDHRSVHKSYHHAKKMLNFSMVAGTNKVVFFENVPAEVSRKAFDLQSYLIEIAGAIKNGSIEAVVTHIDRTFAELKTLEFITPEFIQAMVVEIFFTVTRATRSLDASIQMRWTDMNVMLSNVFELETVEDCKNWLSIVAQEHMKFVLERQHSPTPLVGQVIDYIQMHYVESINLKTVAATFRVHPTYLGQQFKKEIEQSFTEYLNMIRIEKAKELLLETTLKIGEVASKSGYINTNYFFTIFKKATGLSPAEFRGDI